VKNSILEDLQEFQADNRIERQCHFENQEVSNIPFYQVSCANGKNARWEESHINDVKHIAGAESEKTKSTKSHTKLPRKDLGAHSAT
jgi:hypothetical protein